MKVPVNFTVSAALATLLSLLPSTTCRGAPGDLYVVDLISTSIVKFASDGTRTTFASGLNEIPHAAALAFDRTGNLFVADRSIILKFAPDGSKSTFATLGADVYGMAFDGGGNLFVSDLSQILKFAPDGRVSTFAPNLDNVWPLAFDKFATPRSLSADHR